MSNLGGATFKFVHANREIIENRVSKRYSFSSNKDEDSPPDYNSITDAVVYNVNDE